MTATETTADAPSWVKRHRGWLLGAAFTVLFLALATLASHPTGGDDASDAVPRGSRLAASSRLEGEGIEVQVLSVSGRLVAQVAYDTPKGWLGASLQAIPEDTVASWAATPGGGPIPQMSVVYGRAPGTSVVVTWDDGQRDEVETASDGVFALARKGNHESGSVSVLDGGTSVLEIDGP